MARERSATETSAFGVGKREAHDSSAFYARFTPPDISNDQTIGPAPEVEGPLLGDARKMAELPDNSVALVVTSPPYFVGKEYESELYAGDRNALGELPASYREYLDLLHDVFAECVRTLEPGGRIAVNVANLGRKPYRSLSADVSNILAELGLLLRGEIIWQKSRSSNGSCAWGSFRSPANPVLRDVTERVIVASKGRFDRALPAAKREAQGLPHQPTITTDEFLTSTLDVWEMDPESARRVNHPAPFPVELPRRLIDLYTYSGDLVLDPFMGAGTTLVAAQQAGRRSVGYDTDPAYVDLTQARLQSSESQREVDSPSSQAVALGKKAVDIAGQALGEAGFKIVDLNPKLKGTGVSFTFSALSSADQIPWFVEVVGGFTTSKPGMLNSDAVWKVLAKSHVLAASKSRRKIGRRTRLLLLTPHMPRKGSETYKALKAVGSSSVFDVVELLDLDDAHKLAQYGSNRLVGPLPGFWT